MNGVKTVGSGPEKSRPTIREVAKLAGVSHQTVSRYFRSNETVKETLRGRIAEAIVELDYRPNLIAKAMRDRKTWRLALLLPQGTAMSSLDVLVGATAAVRDAGYVVELVTLGGPEESRTARVLELADSGLFEGVVSLAELSMEPSQLAAARVPIIVAPNYDGHMRSVGETADASPIAEIMGRLTDEGHRVFMHVSGDYNHSSARKRRDAYLDAISHLGVRSYAVVDCDWSPERARQAVLDLPEDSGVTAIIGANDLVATGAIGGALDRGWQVPRDISVTGWDNFSIAAAMRPSLTSVAVDYERLGRTIMTRLLAAMQHQLVSEDAAPFTRVIWRASTGVAPGTIITP